MTFRYSNLDRPSNRRFKEVADFLLYTMPLYLGIILTLPIGPNSKMWINTSFSVVIVTLKGLTKFTSDETLPTDVNNTKE